MHCKKALKSGTIAVALLVTAILTMTTTAAMVPNYNNVEATIASDEFCDSNSGHFACDDKVGNSKDDSENNEDDSSGDDWRNSCYDSDERAGKNGPFSVETYNHCNEESDGGSAYEEAP